MMDLRYCGLTVYFDLCIFDLGTLQYIKLESYPVPSTPKATCSTNWAEWDI